MTDSTAAVKPASGTETAPSTATGAVADRFESFREQLVEPEFLTDRRLEAWERFQALPFPTKKSEEWRYTDPVELSPDDLVPAAPRPEREDEPLPAFVERVLEGSGRRAGIFVQRDGCPTHLELDEELAEHGVIFTTTRSAAEDHPELLARYLFESRPAAVDEKFWSLHLAFLSGGYFLYVPRDVQLEHPIHAFRLLSEGGALVATNSLIVAESGAEVTVIDEYLSPDLEHPSLSLAGTVVRGESNANIHYVSLQRYGRGIKHLAMQHLSARRDTRLAGFNVALGGDLSRAEVSSRLLGPGSDSEMLALWFGDGDQHFDHHTLQHHAAPHAHSDLLYKGALTDRGSSVFRGLIRVDKGAQLTDAYQTNRNLLLAEEASATALPNLEIEADDVRCSHGATIGQVDEGQLFYLMSRGLTRTQAERLLVFGFFDEVLSRLPIEGVRARIREAIEEKIGV